MVVVWYTSNHPISFVSNTWSLVQPHNTLSRWPNSEWRWLAEMVRLLKNAAVARSPFAILLSYECSRPGITCIDMDAKRSGGNQENAALVSWWANASPLSTKALSCSRPQNSANNDLSSANSLRFRATNGSVTDGCQVRNEFPYKIYRVF